MDLDRIIRFLNRSNRDFLRGALWEADIEPLASLGKSAGKTLAPEMISTAEVVARAEEIMRRSGERRLGDLPQTISASFNIPWLELLAGCPARIQGDTIWAETAALDYDDISRRSLDRGNAWFRKWLEIQNALGSLAGGRFPVTLPVMHGPLDILSAARGPERLCLDLQDRPQDVERALSALTDLWIDSARALLPATPLFRGGMCSRMKLWLPGPAVTPQNDAAALLSPELYSGFVRRFEERIVRSFPYHTYHSHSTSAHLLDSIAGLPGLSSIQITLDPNGPPRPRLQATIRRLLEKLPVLLCVWDREWADWCRDAFDPGGVCILYIIRNDEDWPRYEDWLGGSRGGP